MQLVSDRPVWWLACDADHPATALGGLGSAWNDPWPARLEAHQRLAARVLGDRFVPAEIPPPSGGLYALAAVTLKKRRGWRTANHVEVDGTLLTAKCPVCGRRAQVPLAELEITTSSDGLSHLSVRGAAPVRSGSTASITRLLDR